MLHPNLFDRTSRSWSRILSTAALQVLVIGTMLAQHWPAYEQYRRIAQQNAADELRSMAKNWSASVDQRERHLGLLALATAELRSEDYRVALNLLDSIRSTVPATEVAIRSTAQRLMANALTLLGDPERGKQEAEAGLRLLPDTGFMRERIGLMNVKAEAQLFLPDGLNDAYDQFARTARVADSVGFAPGHSGSENGMGLIRLNQARYDEAWSHFTESLRLARVADSEMLMQNAVANLSITATMDGRYEQALRLCDSLLNELGDRSPEFRMMLHDEKSVIHRRNGRFDQALTELQRALALTDPANESIHQAKLLQSVAITYWQLGRHSDAFRTMKEVMAAAGRLGMTDLMSEAHLELHDWHAKQGNIAEALRHLQAHKALSDSLQSARYDEQLARSEALYGAEKKDHRIAEQQQALTIAAAEDRRKSIQRKAFIGASSLLGLIALLLFLLLRHRQRMARQQKALHDQQVDQLLSQQEIKSINAMLEGQEKERDRMAKDLHDRLGSMLGGIKANMSALEDRVEAMRQDQQYHKVTRLLDQTVSELRHISHDMAAATLSRFGLEKALNDLRETIHISGRLQVELNTFGLDQRLERSVEIAVYRIVQELVSNVLKHAKADQVTIGVTRAPGRLSVVMSDNGVGFDPGTVSNGMGLSNVRSRAAAIGANVQVDSAPGKGTTVSVECVVVE
ncbi:MAG: tetratricopeptide repeat protein [Flavobacteriales bacterium]|nr:tetratricopeptide repeat protein [Flavobacteriales bacterium]